MTFDKLPEWVAWLAQDADGAWHPQGAGRGCKAAEAATATLWDDEAEPTSRIAAGTKTRWDVLPGWGKPADWEATLTRRDATLASGLVGVIRAAADRS